MGWNVVITIPAPVENVIKIKAKLAVPLWK